jgi:trehalose 6-phosphate phosphatase
MKHLLDPEGLQAIKLAASRSTRLLLAFDFDGTLTPIVNSPEAARLSPAISAQLQRLGERHPLAIVTGRAIEDVSARLGFTPRFIVGNHGAQTLSQGPQGASLTESEGSVSSLDAARQYLSAHVADLAALGAVLEDKRYSLAIHYRNAPDQALAQQRIDALLADSGLDVQTFGGKCVVNVVPAHAPDKSDAVYALMEATGADQVVFAGDDLNDEPVYDHAQPHWVTVRVGYSAQSNARFFLHEQGEMAAMLDALETPAEA